MTQAGEVKVDRRDGLRRRIYLACLILGVPVQAFVWARYRHTDPFGAFAYPPYVLSQVVVMVGLLRRRMQVRTAERVVLVGTALTYLAGLAFTMVTATDLQEVREATTVSSLLTITLLPMLAYVAFETHEALRVSLGIVATYTTIVSLRLLPAVMTGDVGGEALDYLAIAVFLGTTVGLLHVMAQVKEQAAEARLTASAMEALANTDALTGIANRRMLRDALDAHLADATEATPLAVLLLDLDHFKRVNDVYGHDAGDEVLQHVAETLEGQVRKTDLLGRWGGEEFLVIASPATLEEAVVLAERCRTALADTIAPAVGGITASVGVAAFQMGDTACGLLRRADDALYLAKASGRDRVQLDVADSRADRVRRLQGMDPSPVIEPDHDGGMAHRR